MKQCAKNRICITIFIFSASSFGQDALKPSRLILAVHNIYAFD